MDRAATNPLCVLNQLCGNQRPAAVEIGGRAIAELRAHIGHALMFEQDRLQGRINQLFERIEVQLRQVMKEKKY
jgi:hypothetical protein